MSLTISGSTHTNRRRFDLFAALALLLTALALSGCGAQTRDVPVSELSAAVTPSLSNADKLTAMDEDYLRGMLGVSDLSALGEYVLMLQTEGTQLDQYGIFKLPDENSAKETVSLLKDYIGVLRANWGAFNYLPEEQYKLDQAEVTLLGNYVYFTILSEEEASAFNKAIEAALK